MRITINDPRVDDLEGLGGVVVILDIFRAGNTIAALLAGGATEVWLVGTLDLARAIKAAHPHYPLLGERGGLPPEDFDCGNSPVYAPRLIRPGLPVVLTTSAGTRAVHRLTGADAVFYGTFAGASALVRAINEMAPDEVHFLPMGLEAREPAEEDDAAAFFLADMLRGREADFRQVADGLIGCAGYERLSGLGQGEDLDYCLSLDIVDVVPMVRYAAQPPRAVAWRA